VAAHGPASPRAAHAASVSGGTGSRRWLKPAAAARSMRVTECRARRVPEAAMRLSAAPSSCRRRSTAYATGQIVGRHANARLAMARAMGTRPRAAHPWRAQLSHSSTGSSPSAFSRGTRTRSFIVARPSTWSRSSSTLRGWARRRGAAGAVGDRWRRSLGTLGTYALVVTGSCYTRLLPGGVACCTASRCRPHPLPAARLLPARQRRPAAALSSPWPLCYAIATG
jgi:hypothetical protein